MTHKQIVLKGQIFDFNTPCIMGVLNLSADSFYRKSFISNEKELLSKAEQMLLEGAKILDIGAVSTRPGAHFLNIEDEEKILFSSLKSLRNNFPNIIISVDTVHSCIAQKVVDIFEVDIINDVSGGQIDKNMFQTIAKLQVPYILMHMRGTPDNMQELTNYSNLTQEIFYYFSEKINQLNLLGVKDIIIDPGFGFAKNVDQNYKLLASLKEFEIFNKPILIGISRKTMIWKFLGITPNEALNGTSVLNTFALLNGANILRVHDVKEAKEVILIMEKLKSQN